MVRSPIFILLIILCLFSCKDKQFPAPLEVSKRENTKAVALRDKADLFSKKKQYDSAYYYFNESKEIFTKVKDSANLAYSLIQIGYIQQTFGDYNGSDVTLTQALPYIKNDNNYLSSVYNSYGIVSKESGNYEEAIDYYEKALKYASDSLTKQSPRNNMAAVYIIEKKYDKAIPILESILKNGFLKVDSLQDKKARVLDNLGYALYKSNRNKEGIVLMNKSLAIRNALNDSYGSIESYLHLCDYHIKDNPEKSNEYAKIAYKIATEHKSTDERLEALSFLMKSDFEKDARKYADIYHVLNDSVIKVRNRAKNQFAKIRFNSDKEKIKNKILTIEKAKDRLRLERADNKMTIARLGILLLVLLFLVAVLLFIVILKHSRAKTKIEKQKALNAVYETETRISKKLHDELANEVFQVMSFAETQNLENPNKKELLLDNLDKIYSNTRNISRENSSIDTGVNFGSHLKQMLANYESDSLKIIIKNSNGIDWERVSSASKRALFRVLQEFMVNMKKHSKCSIAIISFETKKDILEVKYSDNGIGIGEKLNYKNGLQNAENRIDAINGTIIFDGETEKGFKAKILIPN